MPSAKASTRQSRAVTAEATCCSSLMRGRLPGLKASSKRTPQAPMAKPIKPLSDGQQHAFGQKLAEQAPASGAEGGANGDFFLASGGAGQQQIGDVGAGDQQHETRLRRPGSAEAGALRPPGPRARGITATLSVLSIHFGLAWRNCFACPLHVGLRGFDGYAGLEASGDEINSDLGWCCWGRLETGGRLRREDRNESWRAERLPRCRDRRLARLACRSGMGRFRSG